jgi:hypothetical protein
LAFSDDGQYIASGANPLHIRDSLSWQRVLTMLLGFCN